MATDDEIATYHEVHQETDTGRTDRDNEPIMKAGRGQGVGSPIAEAYSSDPDAILEARADAQLSEADDQAEDEEPEEPEGDDDGGPQQEGEEADEAPEEEEAEEED